MPLLRRLSVSAVLFSLLPVSLLAKYPAYLDGAIVPMVTAYKGPQAEQVDLDAMARLTDYLCQTSAAALFPVSGTGQWDRLSLDEKKGIIETVVTAARKRKPVLAGVGSMKGVEEVIELARFAEGAGVDGIVVVTPDFIRRNQPGQRITDQQLLLDYYNRVCEAVRVPVVLYDPDAEIKIDTFSRLLDNNRNIFAIKYREKKSMVSFQGLFHASRGQAAVLSGSEIFALEAIKNGATGMIGNGLNVYPDLGQNFVKACLRKNWSEARKLHAQIVRANGLLEELGGGAQGIKKVLNDVLGVRMETVNRGDVFKP